MIEAGKSIRAAQHEGAPLQDLRVSTFLPSAANHVVLDQHKIHKRDEADYSVESARENYIIRPV
jgi:hypothetical protein